MYVSAGKAVSKWLGYGISPGNCSPSIRVDASHICTCRAGAGLVARLWFLVDLILLSLDTFLWYII
jgi:hypothetical protein